MLYFEDSISHSVFLKKSSVFSGLKESLDEFKKSQRWQHGAGGVHHEPGVPGCRRRGVSGGPREKNQDLAEEYTQIKPYAGMPKEVLLLYSSQARYRVPREILFWLIVACTLALVALTVTVIALSRAASAGGRPPGVPGIQEQLHHFEYLNIKSVWISPFYRSPMKDFGYDVEDFRAIDPLFGTMHDFEELLAEMHNKGLKLIMDFIPNHTSDRHRWFNLSRTGDTHYKDYYVSIFGNSSWTYDDLRGQCYLHQFLKEQPDLNFRNPHVRQEIIDIIHFWLGKGVDGFRMDAVKHILEAEHLRDEPQVDPKQPPEDVTTEWELYHDYTTSQLGLHDMLREWRAEMDIYSREPGRYRFMVTESYDYHEVEKTMMYYGTPQVKESDFPFNFYLLDLPQNPSGMWVKHLVHLWMGNMPKGQWPNWVVGNHDRSRIASSAGQIYVRVINMLLLTLPGTPTTYNGEEIGMENINVQKKEPGSVLAQYRFLSTLRQSELPLHRGWFCYVHADANVFSYLRELEGLGRAFLMVLNFGKESAITDLSSVRELPDQLKVLMSTNQVNSGKVLQKSHIPTELGVFEDTCQRNPGITAVGRQQHRWRSHGHSPRAAGCEGSERRRGDS
ncbi:hypothetical protein F7725_023837 [Dissostichus mawsoni]|uniref:Glycosyl hydrolase family 13 catalytic domain-containing protein n=1 Tax=Dissostichus mawsoni TaxID=36200 RepID=A0A7J5XXN1_DISMA|nr:hypothetical protein F7725_023837 [Dissostichus mawsoni]